MESAYSDVRLGLVEQLRLNELPVSEVHQRLVRAEQLDTDLLRVLWSTTLLGIDRGGKQKPSVIKAQAHRIERRPSGLIHCFPILSIAVRSCERLSFVRGWLRWYN